MAGVAAAALTAGCGTSGTEILQQPAALVTSGIATLSSVELPKVAIPEMDADPVGTPAELYNRIARGATRCWFGGEGKLRPTHIFNATAEPETKGNWAEIVLHERDSGKPDPRGNRAFTVKIQPEGDNRAKLDIENVRFPVDEGQRMEREVRRWARDDLTCTPRSDASHQATVPAAAAPAKPPGPRTAQTSVKKPQDGAKVTKSNGAQPTGSAAAKLAPTTPTPTRP